jgi:hypothetical protein
VLDIATDDDTSDKTNFAVARLQRDILRRSSVGALFTRRSVDGASNTNHVFGVDSSFSFYQNVYMSAYVAKSQTEGLSSGDDLSYRAQFQYTADRYGLAFDRLVVEDNFNPEVGFMRREDFRRSFASARFSPRTRNNRLVRKWTYQGSIDYITNNDNRLESREASGLFRADFHSSDALTFELTRQFEFIPKAFSLSRDVSVPVGEYRFTNFRAAYSAGSQHRVSGTSAFEAGSFYDGTKKTASFRGRVEITSQLGVEPSISLNWIELPQENVTTTVVGGRTVFTMTPRMFVAALVQYSSSNTSLSTNLRFRWEYQPGSELFVVYTEGRTTLPPHGTDLENRGFVVKINRLFRF